MAVFQIIKNLLIGSNQVDVYGGKKGGYSYLVFWDKLNREVISHYVSPPKKEARNIRSKVELPLVGAGGDINYQSEISYTDPFVIVNKSNKSGLTESDLTAKINEDRQSKNEQAIKPINIYQLEADKSFIAGPYVVPVSPKNIENPTFESHFGELNEHVKEALTMFLEFKSKIFGRGDIQGQHFPV